MTKYVILYSNTLHYHIRLQIYYDNVITVQFYIILLSAPVTIPNFGHTQWIGPRGIAPASLRACHRLWILSWKSKSYVSPWGLTYGSPAARYRSPLVTYQSQALGPLDIPNSTMGALSMDFTSEFTGTALCMPKLGMEIEVSNCL